MAKQPKNEVAVAQTTAVALNDDFFAGAAGDGLQNVRASDLIIPRLTLLQALSPQVQPKKPEYIQGASIGDICDVGTQEIFESPLLFLPVYFIKQYLEGLRAVLGRVWSRFTMMLQSSTKQSVTRRTSSHSTTVIFFRRPRNSSGSIFRLVVGGASYHSRQLSSRRRNAG